MQPSGTVTFSTQLQTKSLNKTADNESLYYPLISHRRMMNNPAGEAGDQPAEADAGGHRRAAGRGGVALRVRGARRGLPPLPEPASLRGVVVQAELEVRPAAMRMPLNDMCTADYTTTWLHACSIIFMTLRAHAGGRSCCGCPWR